MLAKTQKTGFKKNMHGFFINIIWNKTKTKTNNNKT